MTNKISWYKKKSQDMGNKLKVRVLVSEEQYIGKASDVDYKEWQQAVKAYDNFMLSEALKTQQF